MKTAEEIYHRFVRYEWEGISDTMKKSILEAINEALRQPPVSGSLQPLTIDTVNKMLKKVSKETWIAVQGDEHGWKEWYAERCKLNLNSNDR